MKKNITPLGRRVLVEIVEKEKSEGGIYIPESIRSQQESQVQGKVIKLGILEKDEKFQFSVKVGDQILLKAYHGAKINNNQLIVSEEHDILAIINK